MTYEKLMEMSMASLLDASEDLRRDEGERLQASECALARMPEWDGQTSDLDSGQRRRLAEICRTSEVRWPYAMRMNG